MQIKRDIDNCPECEEKHEGLDFVSASTYVPEVSDYPFLAQCPKTKHHFSKRFEVSGEEVKAKGSGVS